MERKENIGLGSSRRRAWRRFRRNYAAMAGLGVIVFVFIMSVMGAIIRPDASKNANAQQLEIAKQKPGFQVDMIYFGVPESVDFSAWWEGGVDHSGESFAVDSLNFDVSGKLISYRVFGSEDWRLINSEVYTTEKKVYLLGTDKYGRDLLSRLMAGAKISLSVGAIAVMISLMVGLLLGLLAGYYRGWVDTLIMWFTNVIWAVPTLLLVMAITFAFGTGFWKVFLAVGLTMWVEVARITRGQVLGVREREYIEAARALGFSDLQIILKHILPNIWSPIIVIAAANFASAILIEAGLSFLGLGAQIPVPSWGNMIREHYAFITTDLAYLAIVPGIMIMLLVLSFMMVGNGLRDALDVKA
jgi:peptide/nickel transport system permease protein